MALARDPTPDESPDLRADRASPIAVMALRAVALLAFAAVLILVVLPVALVAAGA
jgi:hypothetical protein